MQAIDQTVNKMLHLRIEWLWLLAIVLGLAVGSCATSQKMGCPGQITHGGPVVQGES